MTTSTPCAEGCVYRGRHLDECDTTACTGCLPRPAEFGLLCAFGWQRLHSDVVDIATLVHHLRDVAEPHATAKAPTDGPRAPGDPAEASVLPDALTAADELHAALAEVADVILDTHPRAQLPAEGVVIGVDKATKTPVTGPHPNRLDPPDERGVWRSPQALKTDNATGEQYVVRSRVIGIRHPQATDRLAAWVLPLLPWVAQQEWVTEVRNDLATIVSTTRARWPLEDRPRTVPVPCPHCGHLSLHRSPPTRFRGLEYVACSNPECGRMLTEDEWHTAREATA